MKKILALISLPLIIIFIILVVACLVVLNFFSTNKTDGYVENNYEYSIDYINTLNKNIKKGNGYVSLERIIYFYLENEKLSFDEIYKDNLDNENKSQLEISSVCNSNSKYKNMEVCLNYQNSNQIDEIQNKPFNAPLEFSNMNITSFFMEERIVFDEEDIHTAWDFASPEKTKVYSVCNGIVKNVSFTELENKTNKNKSGGNTITISCKVDDLEYIVLYAHLYPNSSKVKVGDMVSHWQEIAGVGTTGYSTGNHLHYEVKLNNKLVDGMSLIDFNNLNI